MKEDDDRASDSWLAAAPAAPRDELSAEQDVIAASKEVTLPSTAASPTRREGTSHSPSGGSSQPWLVGLWSPGSSLVQLSASQTLPRCLSSPEETTRGLARGHRGGSGPAQQTSLAVALL